jgi:hypothetical protein
MASAAMPAAGKTAAAKPAVQQAFALDRSVAATAQAATLAAVQAA